MGNWVTKSEGKEFLAVRWKVYLYCTSSYVYTWLGVVTGAMSVVLTQKHKSPSQKHSFLHNMEINICEWCKYGW